jgi:hypothetical protein
MGIDVNEMRERGMNPGKSSTQFSPEMITGKGEGFNPKGQNEIVTQWASMVQRKLRDSTMIFHKGKAGTISRPGRSERKLSDSIKSTTKKHYSTIDKVTYSFERHGVFIHKGVGRGYEMSGGMVVRTAKSPDPLTREPKWWEDDPQPRRPYEWFNPVLEANLPELADKIAEINADAVLNATRIMIK